LRRSLSSAAPPPPLCLIDCSNLAWRYHFGIKNPLHAPTGEKVHAVFGFCHKLLALQATFPGFRVLPVFDEGRSDQRCELLPTYKQQRSTMPPELRTQMPLMREAAAAFGVPAISAAGYEADDLIASATAVAIADGAEAVAIVSLDKDMLQLVSPAGGADGATRVVVYDDRKKLALDAAAVAARHNGVPPERFVDYLALMGDASDNVPGIPGVGPKTAAKLVLAHGDLEAVLAAARAGGARMPKSKRRDMLVAHGDQARLAKRIVTLQADVPLAPAALRGATPPTPADASLPLLRPFLRRLGFAQLERRCFGAGGAARAAPATARAAPARPRAPRSAAAAPRGGSSRTPASRKFSDDDIPF